MSYKLTGMEAVEYARKNAKMLSKYADPIEDARSDLTPSEAEDVCREDASLIYIVVE
jgi:hypothetical protein